MVALKHKMMLLSVAGLLLPAQGFRGRGTVDGSVKTERETAGKGISKWKKQLCVAMGPWEGKDACKAYISKMETERCPASAANFHGSSAVAAKWADKQNPECNRYRKEKETILEELRVAKEARAKEPERKAAVFDVSAVIGEEYESGKWHKAFCKMRHVRKGADCSALIADEEANCERAAMDTKSRSGPNVLSMNQDPTCNKFRSDVKFAIMVIKRPPPTKNIEKAAKACKPALKDVCETALCPTFKAIEKATGDCTDICASRLKDMWDASTLTEEQLQKRFEDNEGSEALKALLREHAAKCMCVTWRQDHDDSICYDGGMALNEGEKWCEFDRTPSWQLMLAKDPDVTPVAPECEAVAVTFTSEDDVDEGAVVMPAEEVMPDDDGEDEEIDDEE